MSEHPGSRGCYQKGCRALECRVANAVYEKMRRARRRHGVPADGAAVDGYQLSRRLRTLRSDGYRPPDLARMLRVSRVTLWRHLRSWRVRRSTDERGKALWLSSQAGADVTLDPARQKVADAMLNSLAHDWTSHARTWQNIRPADDDA